MTPFKELAERIEAQPDGWWHCCTQLNESDKNFFTNFFKPTEEEREEYNILSFSWMSEIGRGLGDIKNNTDRITALLFADQLWKDKENRKYERK